MPEVFFFKFLQENIDSFLLVKHLWLIFANNKMKASTKKSVKDMNIIMILFSMKIFCLPTLQFVIFISQRFSLLPLFLWFSLDYSAPFVFVSLIFEKFPISWYFFSSSWFFHLFELKRRRSFCLFCLYLSKGKIDFWSGWKFLTIREKVLLLLDT